jgi:lipopolysaccharide/colanic/teichoic acid biosynthesis glycosyltransferase
VSVPSRVFGRWPASAKRFIDIVGSGVALLLLSPVLITVAGVVRLTSAGPVILRQERVGRGGQVFSMLKFRTMVVHVVDGHPADLAGDATNGPFPKLKDDPRITRVGRVLRRASIDELPQLWNVLVGQMSLVGPRPFVLDDAAVIGGWALRRYAVRPGITGLWQVSGRNDLTYDEMCRLDHLYVSCWSLGMDLRVLLRTLRAVSGSHGAY